MNIHIFQMINFTIRQFYSLIFHLAFSEYLLNIIRAVLNGAIHMCQILCKGEYVTLHAKRGLKDFTENREIFSRSRCVNFNFHGVKRRNHSNTKNFHSWRETNHAVNDQ